MAKWTKSLVTGTPGMSKVASKMAYWLNTFEKYSSFPFFLKSITACSCQAGVKMLEIIESAEGNFIATEKMPFAE